MSISTFTTLISKSALEKSIRFGHGSGKVSAQPHAILCIQFLDRENNDKNNTLPLGKQICFTIVNGAVRKFYHGSFVQDIFGVSNLSLFIIHLCKQLLGCKFRCFVSHGDCLSPLWNFGRKSKTTSLYEPMSFLLMVLLTITP